MKDFIITPKRQKREIITFVVCFVISFLLNVYAVIAYQSPAKEIITSFFYVLIFALLLYVVWSIIRILFNLIKRLIIKKSPR
jgi:hypothetical protein